MSKFQGRVMHQYKLYDRVGAAAGHAEVFTLAKITPRTSERFLELHLKTLLVKSISTMDMLPRSVQTSRQQSQTTSMRAQESISLAQVRGGPYTNIAAEVTLQHALRTHDAA